MMKIGIFVGNEMPWSSAATLLEISTRAEELGFHSVWVADHIVLPEGYRSAYPYGGPTATAEESETFFEPLLTLAYLAAATHSIRLGTSVVVAPIRNPVYTAKLVATLDRLSGGRVILGVGAGWLQEEFLAMGSENFATRGQALDEHIAICRSLWADAVASYSGTLYQLPPVRSAPKPAQRPGPPVWIGGNSYQAIRRVARLGDGWHPVSLSAPEVKAGVDRLKTEVGKVGRSMAEIDVFARLEVGFDPNPTATQRNGLYAPIAEIATGLKAYEAAGCTGLVIDPAPIDSPQGRLVTIERLAAEVVPLLSR
jgi:probable F420-dependent oxidoreductase